MNLSLGTWIMIIIICIIISKIMPNIKLRYIFKPTKKAAKHIKNEWDNS